MPHVVISCLSCARQELRHPLTKFCHECNAQRFVERARAIRLVYEAVARGDMEAATAFQCVDCGMPARDYEHRDYTKPLDVEPVCPACNYRRGPALDSQMRGLPYESAQSGVVGADESGVSLHEKNFRSQPTFNHRQAS